MDGGARQPPDASEDASALGGAANDARAGAGGAASIPDGSTTANEDGGLDGAANVVAEAELLDVGFITCFVKPDGTLWCFRQLTSQFMTWQEAVYPEQVGKDADWASISAGADRACGIRRDGTGWCFGDLAASLGDHDIEMNPVPIGMGTWKSLSTNQAATCGVQTDGSLWCWGPLAPYSLGDGGDDFTTPTRIGSATNWVKVLAGGREVCALDRNGSLWCFGQNIGGMIGDGTTTPRRELTEVTGGGVYRSFAIGGVDTCGVRDDGTLWCWGNDFETTPKQVGQSSDWIQVSGHMNQVCARNRAGQAQCFSAGTATFTPVAGSDRFTSVAAGCGVRDDAQIACWGIPPHGDGQGSVTMSPTRVGTASDYTDVAIRWQNRLALHTGGRIDAPGQSIDGTTGWTQISPNSLLNCAIDGSRSLWCWGVSVDGTQPPSALQQESGTDWLRIATVQDSYPWACGIRGSTPGAAGKLWCMSQYGSGPYQVGTDDWMTLSGGTGHACAIRADGSLWCGSMSAGFCDQNGCQHVTFTQVGSATDWTSVASARHNCGIRAGGQLWCWGTTESNDSGAIGNGTVGDVPDPVPVAPGTTWSEVATGFDVYYSWTCGIQTSGTLWCWGGDTYGQLGLGAPGASRLVPERVGTNSDWTHVAASGGADAITCGIRQGELWCWGENQVALVTQTPIDVWTPSTVVNDTPGLPAFCPNPQDGDHDGYAGCLGDCDDADPLVSPFRSEICNGKDDNCDGRTDEGCP